MNSISYSKRRSRQNVGKSSEERSDASGSTVPSRLVENQPIAQLSTVNVSDNNLFLGLPESQPNSQSQINLITVVSGLISIIARVLSKSDWGISS